MVLTSASGPDLTRPKPVVILLAVEPDDVYGDDERHPRLLPPDDRLWRHPSEVGPHGLPFEDATRRSRVPRTWAVAMLAGAVSALLTIGMVAVTGGLRPPVRTVPAVERVVPAGLVSTSSEAAADMTEVSERVRPAVVGLRVERDSGRTVGSGVMFRSDGHLLTNHRVVDGATGIVAVMTDGRTATGRLVGSDPATDIAVVKVDDWTGTTALMGSAAALRVGQDMMVVGSERPASMCQVQALGDQLEREAATTLVDLIRTNVAVRADSSGGALVDSSGAVVGIVTFGSGNVDDEAPSGFAIPIDYARSVADQLLANGAVARVWMGIEGSDLDGETAGRMGLEGGAVVNQVRTGSPAGRAGLVPGDVITSFDATPVASMGALRILLRAHRPGDVVRLKVVREGGKRAVMVELAERPAEG